MYNREPVLPIDVKHNLNKNGHNDSDQEPFDFATFDAVFSSATKVRASIAMQLNIQKLPKKSKKEITIVDICQKLRFG